MTDDPLDVVHTWDMPGCDEWQYVFYTYSWTALHPHTANIYHCYYYKMSAVQGWKRAINTLSAQRHEPHNTNP